MNRHCNTEFYAQANDGLDVPLRLHPFMEPRGTWVIEKGSPLNCFHVKKWNASETAPVQRRSNALLFCYS